MDYRQLKEYNIPERQCIQITECRSISDLYDDRKYKRSAIESGVTRPLNEFFKEKLSNFIASGAEEPEIYLMYHTRHDGRIASLALSDSVREHECDTVYDPQFSANELHTYLKPSAIKRAAGKNKQWTTHVFAFLRVV